MLASVAREVPTGDGWTFEPKYDGIRVLAFASSTQVALRTRNGIDKAAQFPEVVEALGALARRRRRPLVLDGEIVARSPHGLARFQALQERLHQRDASIIDGHVGSAPAAFVALDLVASGKRSLVREPWTARRRALEKALDGATNDTLRIAETHPGDGRRLMERARREGWEGLVAKRTNAPYTPGKRSPHWQKVKIEGRQELVVGGWTEPRRSRTHIGALLLGYYSNGAFVYAGHAGGGFTRDALLAMHRRLAPLERSTSPFSTTPPTNERAHWVRPQVVVEVKFNEWTHDGLLRQPIFVGVRDDKAARDVRREGEAIADSRGNGAHRAANGLAFELSNLDKRYFPKARRTKGDVADYYAAVAAALLPSLDGRPLVLKRYPDGIGGAPFYQQKAPAKVPDGVRVERVANEAGEEAERLVGGSLATLLYSVQLGAIEMHPWHSRVDHIDDADYSILDLDPGPGVSLGRVVQVARWVREELERAGLHGALKTSGSTGLHIYLPLPAATSYESSRLVAEVIATRVAARHPKEATVVRTVKARPAGTVYIDYLQNVEGNSVASVFSVRAREPGPVSTPLEWEELTDELDPMAFTMERVIAELAERRAIWTRAMRRRNRLQSLTGPLAPATTRPHR